MLKKMVFVLLIVCLVVACTGCLDFSDGVRGSCEHLSCATDASDTIVNGVKGAIDAAQDAGQALCDEGHVDCSKD